MFSSIEPRWHLDFVFTLACLVVLSSSTLRQHPEASPTTSSTSVPSFVVIYPHPWSRAGRPADDPTVELLEGANVSATARIEDTAVLVSSCLACGALTVIYGRGNHERYQGKLVGCAILCVGIVVAITTTPFDLVLLGVFPWAMILALFASRLSHRACDEMVEEGPNMQQFGLEAARGQGRIRL